MTEAKEGRQTPAKKLAIICGLDGSGKSTLRRSLEQHGYQILYYKDLKDTIWGEGLNFVNPGTEVAQLDGETRASYLLRYLDAETARINDRLQHTDSVISDGYFLRFFIKERIFGKADYRPFADRKRLADAQYLFLLLDLDPNLSYERKLSGNHKITPYECTSPTREGFVEFQTLQRSYLMDYVSAQKAKTVIDATMSPADICRQATAFLDEHGIHVHR